MRIEVGRALQAGFQGLARQPLMLIFGILAAGFLASMGQALMQGIGGVLARGGLPGQLLGLGVACGGGLAMNSYFMLGILALSLTIARGGVGTPGHLAHGGRVWIPGLVVFVLQGLGFWVLCVPLMLVAFLLGPKGLLLAPVLLAPPVWFWLAMSQAQYLVLDRDLGAIEALQGSYELTRGQILPLLGVYLACTGLLMVLGMVCLVVPLVVPAPWVGLLVVVAGLFGFLATVGVLQVALADCYDRLRRADDPSYAEPERLDVVGVV